MSSGCLVALPPLRTRDRINLSQRGLKDSDLGALLGALSLNPYLKELDLHGNPLAEETKYRLHVIKALPSLRARAGSITLVSFSSHSAPCSSTESRAALSSTASSAALPAPLQQCCSQPINLSDSSDTQPPAAMVNHAANHAPATSLPPPA
jgi:hypothetical protein